MDRDVAFGRWVLERPDTLGLDFIEVDGCRTVTENAGAVAEYFGLVTGD